MTQSNLRATPAALDLAAGTVAAETVSLDIQFDGKRVWSLEVSDLSRNAHSSDADVSAHDGQAASWLRAEWPAPLKPHLTGSTHLSVVDSTTQAQLAASEVHFDDAPSRTSVTDANGHSLMVNKWGRLGISLEAMGEETQHRIIANAARIVTDLTELGLHPFVVGGTLLGGARSGKLLPHDDDADIAYLSDHTNPVDVAREGFATGRKLAALGYRVQHHSATHMQLHFPGGVHEVNTYIDVFAAFFTNDGYINQPFHVRGPMRREEMLPFSTVTLNETTFPAPADVDRWLTINYDENWRTPIPGFKLVTPQETRERFEPWFGGYNFQREFWDDYFQDARMRESAAKAGEVWRAGREWLLMQDHPASTIVDLGCGMGELTVRLAKTYEKSRTLGLDFCQEALPEVKNHMLATLSFHEINLNRVESLAFTRELQITAPFTVVSNHVIEQIGHRARANAWRIARMALHSGGAAWFTFNARPREDITREDPTGWHLTVEQAIAEATQFGLRLEVYPLKAMQPARNSPCATETDREPTGVQVRLVDQNSRAPLFRARKAS